MVASGGSDPGARARWVWDVALSFAGAQRDYVGQVADALKTRGVRCFYDADEQLELWGKSLAEELSAIYAERAATVVVFVSAEYAAQDWTRLERRVALTRAVRERREYVLPARFDDTPLHGLPSDMVTVDLRTRTPQEFAAMIVGKLATLGVAEPVAVPNGGDAAGPSEAARSAGAGRVGGADPPVARKHQELRVPNQPSPSYVHPVGRRRGKSRVFGLVITIVVLSVFTGIVFAAVNAFTGFLKNFPFFDTAQPIVVNAGGRPPWTIRGSGYVYNIDSVTRSTRNPGCSSGPSLTISGFVTRITGNEFTSMSYDVRNQIGFKLNDAGSDTWEESPTLNQRYPIVLNVCDSTPPVTRLKITITDFYNKDGALILQNIPVPTRRSSA